MVVSHYILSANAMNHLIMQQIDKGYNYKSTFVTFSYLSSPMWYEYDEYFDTHSLNKLPKENSPRIPLMSHEQGFTFSLISDNNKEKIK